MTARRGRPWSDSRRSRERVILGRFDVSVGEELVELTADLVMDRSNRNSEDSLTSLKEVYDLFRTRGSVDGCPVAQKSDVTVAPPLADLLLELLECRSDLVQTGTGVLEALDDSQRHNVLECVEALCPGSRRYLQ